MKQAPYEQQETAPRQFTILVLNTSTMSKLTVKTETDSRRLYTPGEMPTAPPAISGSQTSSRPRTKLVRQDGEPQPPILTSSWEAPCVHIHFAKCLSCISNQCSWLTAKPIAHILLTVFDDGSILVRSRHTDLCALQAIVTLAHMFLAVRGRSFLWGMSIFKMSLAPSCVFLLIGSTTYHMNFTSEPVRCPHNVCRSSSSSLINGRHHLCSSMLVVVKNTLAPSFKATSGSSSLTRHFGSRM